MTATGAALAKLGYFTTVPGASPWVKVKGRWQHALDVTPMNVDGVIGVATTSTQKTGSTT